MRDRTADAKALLSATLDQVKADDVPSLAAGVAFKIFLSLFPAMIAGVALFSLITTPSDLSVLLNRLAQIAPTGAMTVVEPPLRRLINADTGTAGLLVVGGVLGGLWAASSAAVTLMKALSRAYNVEETRKFVGQRVVALTITAALFGALTAITLLLVFGRHFQDALLARLEFAGPAEGIIAALVTAGRLLGAVAILMVLLAFTYWIGPDRPRPRWRWISPGAVTGVVIWLAVSLAFSVYTSLVDPSANPAYAGLGGVIALLLWLQLSMIAVLVGAELNAVLAQRRSGQLPR